MIDDVKPNSDLELITSEKSTGLYLSRYKRCSFDLHSRMSAILGYLEIIEEMTDTLKHPDIKLYLYIIEDLCKEILKEFDNSLDEITHCE